MSPSTIERCAALVAALVASACRFGGPSGDPTSPMVDGSAGVAGAGDDGGHAGSGQAGVGGAGGQAGHGGSGGASGEHDGTNPGGAAGAAADASIDVADEIAPEGGDEGDDAFGDVIDADSPEATPPTGCLPPFSSVICDPVCNTGCPALFRCDTTDMPRTGVCVGTLLSSVNEGMACTRTAVTDDCLERLSCVGGICRRLCYRDAECTTAGTCCNTAIDLDGGPSGYRICAPCMP